MRQITFRQLCATNDVFTKLNNLRRWTDFTTQPKYNELSKQALNCIAAFMLANRAIHDGKKVCLEFFPRIALGRAYAKAYVYFDTPEHKIDEICILSGISKRKFDIVATEIISEKTDSEFADFLSKDIGDYEIQIYKAATKIATYIELLEQQKTVTEIAKFQEIERELDKYTKIPGVAEFSNTDSSVFKLLQKLSTLRNQNRWATNSYNLECSVLGHLFDTAVWAYLIGLDESNFNEEYATQMFFMGIFHDVAEVWTKDIPSPIKDRIEGFRRATEAYELQMLEKHMYTAVPDYLAKALKSVMIEDEGNSVLKSKVKAADYLSADSECYRFLQSGSRDVYFCDAIINRKIHNSSVNYCDIHEYFAEYSQKIKDWL